MTQVLRLALLVLVSTVVLAFCFQFGTSIIDDIPLRNSRVIAFLAAFSAYISVRNLARFPG